MVVGERVDAPEFELDDKSQQGFISWFKALPQVINGMALEWRTVTFYTLSFSNIVVPAG
jgi:hypothetical protein